MNEKLMGYLKGFEDKYPRELDAKFPRIVENIAQLWGSPGLAAYLSSLLIDDRGNRQGFPQAIAREIFVLSNSYDEIVGLRAENGDAWANERQVAKDEIAKLGLSLAPKSMLKAAESRNLAQVELFLKAGMPVDVRDERQWTPLMVAAFNGSEAVAQLLIKHGADIHARDRGGYTPLHWAALNGYRDVVRLLIGRGVDRNIRSNYGWTPLLQAAAKGHAAIAADLIDAGADPGIASHDGWTPLHKAVSNGHKETVALLLDRGASIRAPHRDGSTPLSIAQQGKHPEIREMLRRRDGGKA